MALDLNDKTSNGNNLTNNGATEYTASTPYSSILRAADLTTPTKYLTATNSTSLQFTSAFTIMLWVHANSTPSSGNFWFLVDRYNADDTNSNFFFAYRNNGGTLQMSGGTTKNTTTDVVNVNYTLTTNTWTHFALTWNGGTQTYKFYVNGSQQGADQTGANTSANAGTYNLYIGAKADASNGPDFRVADIRLYNTDLAAATISSTYNALLTGTEANLKAWYPFQTINSSGGAFLYNFV